MQFSILPCLDFRYMVYMSIYVSFLFTLFIAIGKKYATLGKIEIHEMPHMLSF